MGVWLFTGLPGAGKTLAAVKEIVDVLKPQGRPIYADIDGLQYEELGIKRLVPEDVTSPEEIRRHLEKWHEAETGAVIVIDECQRIFPPRAPGAKVPETVSQFETHRHNGHDVLLITQAPRLLDSHVRSLVERHVHLRRTFGLSRSVRYEWYAVNENPQAVMAYASAVTSTFKFPTDYFRFYKSATVHTVKPRIPWRPILTLGAALAVVVGGFGWYLLSLSSKQKAERQPQAQVSGVSQGDLPPSIPCSVAVDGVAFGETVYRETATGRRFTLPASVEVSEEGGHSYLRNLHSGNRYLICASNRSNVLPERGS